MNLPTWGIFLVITLVLLIATFVGAFIGTIAGIDHERSRRERDLARKRAKIERALNHDEQ